MTSRGKFDAQVRCDELDEKLQGLSQQYDQLSEKMDAAQEHNSTVDDRLTRIEKLLETLAASATRTSAATESSDQDSAPSVTPLRSFLTPPAPPRKTQYPQVPKLMREDDQDHEGLLADINNQVKRWRQELYAFAEFPQFNQPDTPTACRWLNSLFLDSLPDCLVDSLAGAVSERTNMAFNRLVGMVRQKALELEYGAINDYLTKHKQGSDTTVAYNNRTRQLAEAFPDDFNTWSLRQQLLHCYRPELSRRFAETGVVTGVGRPPPIHEFLNAMLEMDKRMALQANLPPAYHYVPDDYEREPAPTMMATAVWTPRTRPTAATPLRCATGPPSSGFPAVLMAR